MMDSADSSTDALCTGESSLFRLAIFSVTLLIIGTAVVVSVLVVVGTVVMVDVVVAVLLLVTVVVGVGVVAIVALMLFALVEVEMVVGGFSGTNSNTGGGTDLGRKPTHLSHIAPPFDDSPLPRKTSVNS